MRSLDGRIVAGAIGAAALAGISINAASPARAQAYPNKTIVFVCAYQAGGSSDAIVRFIAEKVRPLAGQTILVENRQGANGAIAAEYVARAKPDGYTLLVHSGSTLAANMFLLKNQSVDPSKVFRVAATINKQSFIIAVDASRPWKTLAELTQAMRDRGGKATYATYASSGTIMGALYKLAQGFEATEVVYRVGAQTLNDLASGSLDFGVYDPGFALAQDKAGRLRMLAISSRERLSVAPQLPTMVELGMPQIVIPGWFAAIAPAETPDAVVETINGWFRAAVAQDDTKAFLNRVASDPWIATPKEGQDELIANIAIYRDAIRAAKIEPQ